MRMPRILSVLCGAIVACSPWLASAQGERESRPRDATAYWIGVRCVELPQVARAQLDLPSGQGVLVDDVVVGAPAQKAGLERFDVIVAIGGEPLADPRELADAVAQSDGDELTIDYRRGGKLQSLKVRPERRSENMLPDGRDEMERAMRRWLERPDRPMSLRFFHPGMVMPQGAPAPELPEDMTVTIEKKGGQPANVTVTRGEQTWQATEKSLDRLPPEARPYVDRALGATFDPRALPSLPPSIREPAADLDGRELRRMRDELDELRRKVGELDDLRRELKKRRN